MALNQQSFRFGIDDSSDPDTVTFSPIDGVISSCWAGILHLRVQIGSTNMLPTVVRPVLFVDVNNDFSTEVQVSSSSTWARGSATQVAEGTVCDENKCLSAASFNTGGNYTADNTSAAATLSNGQAAEWQFGIQLQADARGRIVYFRTKNAGLTLYASYTPDISLRSRRPRAQGADASQSPENHGGDGE